MAEETLNLLLECKFNLNLTFWGATSVTAGQASLIITTKGQGPLANGKEGGLGSSQACCHHFKNKMGGQSISAF